MVKYYYYYPDKKELVLKDPTIPKGVLVILGENRNENDALVKEADGDDMWFHVANHPSGHAIYTGDNISNDAIARVALLVKEQSKLKNMKSVSINYIQRKYIKPTKNPGQVTLSKNPNVIKI